MRNQIGVVLALATMACGGSEPGLKTAPVLPVVTAVSIATGAVSVQVGSTVPVVADVRDQNGAAMGTHAVTWSSSAPAVASISSTTAVAANLTGLATGTATITASVGGKSATAVATVTPPPISTVSIAAMTALRVGLSQPLTVTLRDAAGVVLTGRTITFVSSASAVATVSASGVVTGVGAGSATITVTSEGVIGTVQVFVIPADATGPAIHTISSVVLIPGSSVTVTGSGFDATRTNNSVRIRGASAAITSATETQLVITVPCMTSGSAPVQVTTPAGTSPAFTSSVLTTQRSIAVGRAEVLSTIGCNELPAIPGARYLISVFSTTGSANTLVDFEITGNPSGVVAQVAPAMARLDVTPPTSENARDRAHFQQLERNRAILEEGRRLMADQPRLAASAARRIPVATVGETRDFFYTYNVGCNDTTTRMHTQAIVVGTRAIIWEDTTNTLRSSANADLLGYYTRLGQIFDQDQYAVVRDNFGDPLLRDAATDADGRINMVFSQKLNGTGAAAFVTSCDQFAPTATTFLGSNFGQVFYSTVPTQAGSNVNSTAFPDGWFTFINRTVVHEVKHIASLSARVANGTSGEESWLEEGTARHAEELWARNYFENTPWKSDAGWGTPGSGGIYCDFHPENSTCNALDALRRPSFGMRRQFNELLPKLQLPWNWSVYGDGTGQTGSVFYQTTWSLVRFAVDRYATSEAAFFTALTSSTARGLSNLAAVSGTTVDNLFGFWTLALYADNYPGLPAASADIQIATWNLRSIYGALNADPSWSTRFNTPYPVVPVALPYGTFASFMSGMRGGSNALFELSGTAIPQVLNVHSSSGGPASSVLRMAIARLQ